MENVNCMLSADSTQAPRVRRSVDNIDLAKCSSAIAQLQVQVDSLNFSVERIDSAVYGRTGSSGIFSINETVRSVVPKVDDCEDRLIAMQMNYEQLKSELQEIKEARKTNSSISWQVIVTCVSVFGGGLFAVGAAITQVYIDHKLDTPLGGVSIQQVR